MKKPPYTVTNYLFDRLKELGMDDIFGVPGDFVLGVFHMIEESNLRCICTCNEINAAYAADGYARRKGIGALVTTYVVGELSAINGVAGAYAERVPIVQITGCPATKHYEKKTLLHHTLGDYLIPLHMYEKVTVASTLLRDPQTAPAEIDRVLKECLYHKLPVYIGIPTDMAVAACEKPKKKLEIPARPASDPKVLQEAVQEAHQMLESAKKPVIVVDGEIARFNAAKEVQDFIEVSSLPFATMMLGKSIIDEHHPQFIGLYEGDRSREYVRKRVEEADCILMLGAMLTDFNTGGFTAVIDDSKAIFANIDQLRVRHHHFKNVNFKEFLKELGKKLKKRDPATLELKRAVDGCPHRATLQYQPEKGKKLTLARFFDRVSHFLNDKSIMIVETGSALFAGAEVLQPKGCSFMSQTFFGSIGYTVGSTLGVAVAEPKKRACLFVGDGSFQVTCQDVSTMIRYGTNPIIFLINNDGYLVERVISDGPFNDLQPWKYHKIPELFAGGWGCKVQTEDELEKALSEANSRSKEVVFIEVVLDKWDSPPSMTKAGAAMAKNNFLV
jgi:indolepyruvate decarboxylase